MRKILFFGLVIFFVIGSNLLTFGQSTAQSLIDKFFNNYETKGAIIALEELYKTNSWNSHITDDITNIKNKLAGYNEELVGKYYGYIFLDKIESVNCFSIYTYLLKFDRQPLRLTFKLYKPNDKWVLYSFSFDDTLDDDLEKALNLRYSIKQY
jgi:hypothetical protein